MILQLVLVFLTGCISAQGTPEANLRIQAGVRFSTFDDYVKDAETSDLIWVQNGWDNTPVSVNGVSVVNDGANVPFPWHQEVLTTQRTWIWTTGSDALLVDFFKLHANDNEQQWGYENSQGWCLSQDHWSDAAQFNWENWGSDGDLYIVPDWRCYTLLELRPDGGVWYYYDDTWTPQIGRRAMEEAAEEAGIPSTEDVQACQDDPNTDTDEDCGPMVAQIIKYEVETWMTREAFHQEANEEDTADVNVDNTDTEAETDNRRVLGAVKRLLKA